MSTSARATDAKMMGRGNGYAKTARKLCHATPSNAMRQLPCTRNRDEPNKMLWRSNTMALQGMTNPEMQLWRSIDG